MQAPGRRPAPSSEISPGLGRRGFLSVGGGVLAGAGALSLPRAVSGLHDETGTARPAIHGLRAIYPADPRYATMRMGFNRRWVGSPAYIQVVRNARQTVAAVQRAHDAGLRITVRGGGHCYENFSSGNHGGVIIDMSGMQGVHLDHAGRACVEGGATLWNVYETLFKARLVRARKDDPQTGRLLWAHTGGGGGNFGIVTAYYFARLPSPPVQVRLATTTWPWSGLTAQSFATLLRNYGRFMEAHSSPSSPFAGLFSLLHLYHHSAGQISMTTQAAGPAFGLLPSFLAQIAHGVPGGTTTMETLPWLQATQTLNGSGPNQRGKYKSAYMKTSFPHDQIRAIHRALTDPHYANPQALLQVDSYGCQVNVPRPHATAVAQRSSLMKLQYQTYWTSPEDDEVNLRWINRFYASVYAASGGVPASNRVTDGCFINYPDVDLPSSWPALYYKGNYPGLQAVKARWDPHNVFNHAQSITPAGP